MATLDPARLYRIYCDAFAVTLAPTMSIGDRDLTSSEEALAAALGAADAASPVTAEQPVLGKSLKSRQQFADLFAIFSAAPGPAPVEPPGSGA